MFKIIIFCLLAAFGTSTAAIKCLCIGQSNMVGPGMTMPYTIRVSDSIVNWDGDNFVAITEPTIVNMYNSPLTSIGNRLYYYTQDSVYFINSSWNGAILYGGGWSDRGAGTLYQITLDRCSAADMTPDVIFMFQGESDALAAVSASNYLTALNQLVTDFREHFNNSNLPFIIAKLGHVYDTLPTEIRSAQEDFGTLGSVNNRRIIGLESLPNPDGLHYTTDALEEIGQLFAIKYFYGGEYTARTWSGAVSTDLNNPENWDGSGEILPTDNLIINAGSVAGSASDHMHCNSITTTSGYSGNISFGGYSLRCENGSALFDHTGTLNLGDSIILNAAQGKLKIGAGVGTLTSSSCNLIVNGTTSDTLTITRAHTFKSVTVGPAAYFYTYGTTVSNVFNNPTGIALIIRNNATINNYSPNQIAFTRGNSGPLYSIGTGYTTTGVSPYTFGTYANDVTLSCSTFSYSGAFYLGYSEFGTNQHGVTFNFTGDIVAAVGQILMRTVASSGTMTVNTNGHRLTAGVSLTLGAYSGGTAIYNLDTSIITIGSFNGTLTGWDGAVSTINMGTSYWIVSKDWIPGTMCTINRGVSTINMTGPTASKINHLNKPFYNLIINKSSGVIDSIGTGDTLQAHKLTMTSGKFKQKKDLIIVDSLIVSSTDTTIFDTAVVCSVAVFNAGSVPSFRTGSSFCCYGTVTNNSGVELPENPCAAPPTITSDPVAVSDTTGETANMFISAIGTAPITYQWQDSTESGVADITGETDSTLSWTLALADSGTSRRCIASNAYGDDTSTWALVRVYYRQTVTDSIRPNPQYRSDSCSLYAHGLASTGGGIRVIATDDTITVYDKTIFGKWDFYTKPLWTRGWKYLEVWNDHDTKDTISLYIAIPRKL